MARLIDADALEKEGWSLCRTFQKQPDTMVYETKKLSDLPTVEERKTGHWIDIGCGQECSVCGEVQYGYDGFRRFCANCGAKMEGAGK